MSKTTQIIKKKNISKTMKKKSYFGMGDVGSQGVKRMMQNEFEVLGRVLSPTHHTTTRGKREMEFGEIGGGRGSGRRRALVQVGLSPGAPNGFIGWFLVQFGLFYGLIATHLESMWILDW